jgi:hypothetical protein
MTADVRESERRWGDRLRPLVWGGAATLLALPAVAMRFSSDWDWGPGDFVFAGLMLGGAVLAFELAVRVSQRLAYLFAMGLGVAAAFLQIWINLAVGIVGSEDNPWNGMYAAVVGVAVAGAVIARLRPAGMVWAMGAAAFAQAVVFAVALMTGNGFTPGVTALFCAMWLSSASLFHKAAQEA